MFWKRGQISELAKLSGIPINNLSEILHRKRRVSAERAILLEEMSDRMLERPIQWHEWLFNETSKHPAFFGSPMKEVTVHGK